MDNLFSTYVVDKFLLNKKIILVDLADKFLAMTEQIILKAIEIGLTNKVNPYRINYNTPNCYGCDNIYTIVMHIPDRDKIIISDKLYEFVLKEKYGNQSFMSSQNISNFYYVKIVIKLNKVNFYKYAKKIKPGITEELKCFEYTG